MSPEKPRKAPSCPRKLDPAGRAAWRAVLAQVEAQGGDPHRCLIEMELAADSLRSYRELQGQEAPDPMDINRVCGKLKDLMSSIARISRVDAPPEEQADNPFSDLDEKPPA